MKTDTNIEAQKAKLRELFPEIKPCSQASLYNSSVPESIPEDRVKAFPCDCGGSIAWAEGLWECDTCDFKQAGEP